MFTPGQSQTSLTTRSARWGHPELSTGLWLRKVRAGYPAGHPAHGGDTAGRWGGRKATLGKGAGQAVEPAVRQRAEGCAVTRSRRPVALVGS